MIYKDYTIKKDTTRNYLNQIIDADGKVVAMETLVIDCKKIIDSLVKAGK